VIEIRELYKYYGDRRAVGPLEAHVEKGEVVGLLGLNGAGKTTTLRILACDLLPTSGVVRVDGVDVVENPYAVRTKIGYLPDEPPLYGDMTVAEYLAFAAKLRFVPPGDVAKRVTEALKRTRLSKRADDVVSTLSHGYKQRLGIAQAIVHEPSLVVLDEPINGLDPVQIVEMRKLVRSLGGDRTVIVSSHNLSEISETCDRILVITDGQVSAAGTEAELSAQWLERIRIAVTARESAACSASEVESALSSVPGVVSATKVAATEPGEGVVSFEVEASEDVRDRLCHALVTRGVPVLEVRRNARELESVFLSLAKQGTDAEKGEEGA
jgi:ABC-2 type transport system ATP-binding protein